MKVSEQYILSHVRKKVYKIFNKLSNEDLIELIKICKFLDIQSFVLSFAIEILDDRNVFYKIRKSRIK